MTWPSVWTRPWKDLDLQFDLDFGNDLDLQFYSDFGNDLDIDLENFLDLGNAFEFQIDLVWNSELEIVWYDEWQWFQHFAKGCNLIL